MSALTVVRDYLMDHPTFTKSVLNYGPWAWMGASMLGQMHSSNEVQKEMLRKMVHPIKFPKGMLVLDTKTKAKDYINKYTNSEAEKNNMRQMVNHIFQYNDNAFAMVPDKKGPLAIIVSPGIKNDMVTAHEVGHIIDMKKQKIRTGKDVNKIFKPHLSFVQATFLPASTTPRYQAEARAWDYSGVSPESHIRRHALNTYKHGLATFRPIVWGNIASLLAKTLLVRDKTRV